MLVYCIGAAFAADPTYDRDVASWQEETRPSQSDKAAYFLWFYAANHSRLEWRVFAKDGQVHAQRREDASGPPPLRPTFTPQAGQFLGASDVATVDDGWLVGFNNGEFGAALYWFSRDAKRSYKLSDHQVVDFFSLPDGIHAIEGLAHLGMSRGSVIRIIRPKAGGPWQATSVVELPLAPYAVSVRRHGTIVVTLSDALVAVGPDRKIATLLADAGWGAFYPNSSVLTQDEQRLYIGMRQFVGEVDLATRKVRFLIPSKPFLNKLPKDHEDQVRRQYGG